MKRPAFSIGILLTLLLLACSSVAPAPVAALIKGSVSPPADPRTASGDLINGQSLPELTDKQGAVTVTIQPLNVGNDDSQLKFKVSLNTHSVDLNMDLAALASITNSGGVTVQAIQWDAPRGGHHVEGTLIFPASVAGKSFVDGATKLTLVIKNVDVPERIFIWSLVE